MGWSGAILLIVGLWLIRKKKRLGWLFGVVGNLALTIAAWRLGSYDFVFINSVMMVINLSGWVEWGREKSYLYSLMSPQFRPKWWQVWK